MHVTSSYEHIYNINNIDNKNNIIYIYINSTEGVVMGPAFGFRTRFIIVGKVERASSNNKATNLQNLEETKKTKKTKTADTMSGRNLDKTRKTKQKQNCRH